MDRENAIPKADKILLIRNEVAEILKVSSSQVRDITYEGKLPVIHIGRAVRYDPKDVETFIMNNKARYNACQPLLEVRKKAATF
jgi:excisionase family DNA binding protein